LYGVFVWARRALNSQKRRFPARAGGIGYGGHVPGGMNMMGYLADAWQLTVYANRSRGERVSLSI
jgi:hypothetical protein